MKHLAYILLGLAVVAFGACGGNQFRDRLCHLDSLLIEHPDSVLQVLEGMHEEALTQAKGNRMRYELMRADAQNKAYVDFTTDSVMKTVADYYDHHGSANEQMRAHYLLGCTYRDLQDVPMELQCFQEAVEKADTTSKDCDLYTLVAIYGQMADIYHSQYLPKEELDVLSMCEEIAWMDKDTLTALKAYELRMRPYYLLNNKDSVLAISKKAYKHYIKHGYNNEAISLLAPTIEILVERKQYEEARYYLNTFETNIISNNKTQTANRPIMFNHDKGILFLEDNKIDSAIYCFNKLLLANEKETAYQGLLSLYEKTNQPDSIAKYAKLFAEANDSSYIGKNFEVIAQMTAMYNYGHQEKIAKEKTIESANARTMTLIISSTASIILILLLITITLLRHRHNEKERIHKEQEKLLLKRYNETKTAIAKLEKEKEALIVDNANIDLLLHTINRFENEKTELEAKLRELNQITDDVDFMAWYESFIDCNAAKNLHTKTIIAPNKTVEIEDELWDELIKQIKRNCPAFLTILDSYSLTPTYYKIILLNTFDFTNGEISILLNKTNQQISNIHNRISKKIFPSCKETRKLKQNIQKILKEKRINL